MPWLDHFLKRMFSNLFTPGAFGLYIRDRVQKRLQHKPTDAGASKPDLVSYFVSSGEKYPVITPNQRAGVLCANLLFTGLQSPHVF